MMIHCFEKTFHYSIRHLLLHLTLSYSQIVLISYYFNTVLRNNQMLAVMNHCLRIIVSIPSLKKCFLGCFTHQHLNSLSLSSLQYQLHPLCYGQFLYLLGLFSINQQLLACFSVILRDHIFLFSFC
jgi:hypothetical protein